MNARSFNRTFLCLITMLFFLVGCTGKAENAVHFKSDFTGIATRSWIGPEYRSYPQKDWQVSDEKLVCLVSDENRNVHLLTRQLGADVGTFEMEVEVGFYNKKPISNNKNWAGFSLGEKGVFSDITDYSIYSKGLNIGVSTNGVLFIGNPSPNHKNENVMKALSSGVNLKVRLTPEANTYKVDFAIYERTTGKLLANISKKHIAKEMLVGGLALVSNFQNSSGSHRDLTKSVWFQDWKLKGTKVVAHKDRVFGPILFSEYKLSQDVLQVTAQLAAVEESDKKVLLQLKRDEKWKTIAEVGVDIATRTAKFKIENWDDSLDVPYRLVYVLKKANKKKQPYYWNGIIRKKIKDKLVEGGFIEAQPSSEKAKAAN